MKSAMRLPMKDGKLSRPTPDGAKLYGGNVKYVDRVVRMTENQASDEPYIKAV